MGDGIRIAVLALLTLLLAVGCSDDPNPGPGALATPCDEDADCESLICAGLPGEQKLCTVACTDPIGDECDPGFRCRRPDDSDRLACVCTSPLGCEDEQPNELCRQASDCDDGIDCTAELCDGGRCIHRLAPQLCALGESCRPQLGGCMLGEPCAQSFDCEADPCSMSAQCDRSTNHCLYTPLDLDGDGFLPSRCGGDDCDDSDSLLSPDENEHCDSIDNDCDGDIDEIAANEECGGGVCTNGSCGCSPGLVDCSSSFGGAVCIDTQSDPGHCGQCGFLCQPGLMCFDGVCAERDGCESGAIDCPTNSSCVNVPGNIECRCDAGFEPNGGATACADIDECNRGFDNCGVSSFCLNTNGGFICTCESGFELFGGDCLDVDECSQGFDCGTGTCVNLVGTVECSCDFGSELSPVTGTCVIVNECQAGAQLGHRWCDGSCRDLLNDVSYCGSCDNACSGPGVCVNGSCACSNAGLTYCDGVCVNAHTSTTDCGTCGNSCAVGASCVADNCQCPDGQVPCGGVCQSIGTTARCSGCDDVCPQGASCTGSGCSCPGSAPDVCNGRCVNSATDPEHCGGCGGFCDVGIGMACQGGECRCPSQAPNLCGAACKNFQTDEDACGDCVTQCSGMCVNGECNNGN
jgi:hypothetical protein